MLEISQELVDAIVAHARRDHPDEACASLPACRTDQPVRFIPMVNAARSPTFYEFDSPDLLRLYRELAANDEDPVVIYHCIPRRRYIRLGLMSPTRPNRTRTTSW